jgi:hypothetical protein
MRKRNKMDNYKKIVDKLMPYIIGWVEPKELVQDLCEVADRTMTIAEFEKKWEKETKCTD